MNILEKLQKINERWMEMMLRKNFFNQWFQKEKSSPQANHSSPSSSDPIPFFRDLKRNINYIQKTFGNSTDLVIRTVQIGKEKKIPASVVYIDGLVDTEVIQDHIIESLIQEFSHMDLHLDDQSLIESLRNIILSVSQLKEVDDLNKMVSTMLSGNTILLIDGLQIGLIMSTQGGKDRGVSEPDSQTVIRGPREGFTEKLRINTSLIRRRIRNPNLWLETMTIGNITRTEVSIMYIQGIANEKVLKEVRKRLKQIDIDGIFESGYIEELIQDKTYSPFPTVYNTERPDIAAANLLEGRIAILVDGTPFVLLAPALFVQFYQSAEDYYQRADYSSAIRFIRLISFFLALLAPSIYISVTTFHQEMMPPILLMSIAEQREGVPFPAFVEALMMEISFEILREAGIRMPRAVGHAISIVGTLVIGLAGVEAGLVSAVMVIVVSITAISNFVIPSYSMAVSVRLLRFALMVLAASFGLYGIALGLFLITVHLCSLRSFGFPYMSPLAPFVSDDHKDTFFRFPQWGLITRPRLMSQRKKTIPSSPKEKGGKP